MLIAPGGAGRKARHAVGNQMSIARGTESSNPLPSSGESANPRSLARDPGYSRAQRLFLI